MNSLSKSKLSLEPRMTRNPLNLYNDSLALLTDLYQLTMAYGYWKAGLEHKEAVFNHFFRKRPFNGQFCVTAGLENFIDYLQHFHFDDSDLNYLATLKGDDGTPLFHADFFNYLRNLKFTCDIDAIPEGSVVFPYEPMVRVKGPLIQCQLLESPLLNLLNFPTLIATKAARVCHAAGGDPVIEFGMRRAQGIDGALTASRSAFIGGCESTSNVLAGKKYGIPVRGTQSHGWIMTFDNELDSFKTYAEMMPNNCVFLVDTYDSIEGVKKAISVGFTLKKQGKKLQGIRLDSGDLAYLSIKTRELLDDAGFSDTKIIASNELDEMIIADLKRQGAKIDVWGVGTHLVTAGNQPSLDGVYKLSAIRDPNKSWKYKLKLSEQINKISNPGITQVRRYTKNGEYFADLIYDESLGIKSECTLVHLLDPTRKKIMSKDLESRDLLVPIFRNGKKVYQTPSLIDIQKTAKAELAHFQSGIRRFINPQEYLVGMEKDLYNLKMDLIHNIRSNTEINYTEI